MVGANIFFSCATITRDYSVGNVPGASSVVGDRIGGVVGMCSFCGSGYITLQYPCSVGVYNCSYLSDPANGTTDSPMRLQASYAGWNFSSVWTMDGNPEYPYPEIQGMSDVQVQAEAISVSQNTLSLISGKTCQLSAEVTPAGATDSGVVWLSSDSNVVSVSDSGLVTAVAEGTAVITVTAIDGGFTGTCTVSVSPLALATIEVNTLPEKTDYIIGDILDMGGLTLTATYNDDSKQTISTGFEYSPVVFDTAGIQTVAVTYCGKRCTFDVTVSKIDASGFSVMVQDQTYTGLPQTPAPIVCYGGKTLISGEDYKVEYADNISTGTATVTITGTGNYTGTKTAVFVINKADAGGFNVALIPNQTYTGSPIRPNPTVWFNGRTLTLGYDYAVTFDNNTEIGTATVTVTGSGNSFEGTKTVTFEIMEPSTVSACGVKLSSQVLSLQNKGTAKLTATVTPTNATNKNVTWASSNEKVATVDANGNVTAMGAGTAIITVITKDGGYTASCTVTVKTVWWQWLIKIMLFGWAWY